MKHSHIEIKKLSMTKSTIRSIIDIDKKFYINFDYSDDSWYFNRYNKKNEVTVLTLDDRIVGYYLFLNISNKLLSQICNMQYSGDFYFPENELNADTNISYLASVLVRSDCREFSPVLLRSLFREFKQRETVVVITVSEQGKKMAQKFMSYMGDVKKGVSVFLKTQNMRVGT